jgi:glutathione reductase (NADPH)
MNYDYDLFVIGAGSGGVRCARMSASFGARVAVCEDRYMGGTCVNVGCVPKKLFVYGSQFKEEFSDSAAYGWDVEVKGFDWDKLRDNKTHEIDRLNGIYRNMLGGAGVTVIDGRGRIAGPNTVEVNGQSYTAERILIATGGWPTRPSVPGAELMIDSNEIFHIKTFPKRFVVLGGGYIATEFAGIFAGLGSEVTQIYRGEQILRGFDGDIRTEVSEEIAKKGVNLALNCNIVGVTKHGDELQVELTNGEMITADAVLTAIGRHPNIENLGALEQGVTLNERGYIDVNPVSFETKAPNVYAVGDIIGGMELTPVALAEGMSLAHRLFNDHPYEIDYADIATAVFCQPNIGTVGLTEEQARDRFDKIRVYTSKFRPMKFTVSGRDERSFMKLIVDDASDRVIGCHMVGPDAGEIIQGLAVAMKAGATKAVFDATIGIHPTAAEEFVTMRQPTRN